MLWGSDYPNERYAPCGCCGGCVVVYHVAERGEVGGYADAAGEEEDGAVGG